MTYDLSGIPVRIEKKKIKNIHIYVKPPHGEVLVTAPLRMPDRFIEQFLLEKEDWVRRNVERFQNDPVTADPDYETGDVIAVWGELYTLEVREGTRYRLDLMPDTPVALLTVRTGSTPEQRRNFVHRWYKDQLAERVNILLPQWEAYTGLHCSGWKSRRMKTEWGSCNVRTKMLTFNTRLAEHPVECLEYIILHELAHTVVPNHGPDFKAIETRYMPDWKEVRKRLNGKSY